MKEMKRVMAATNSKVEVIHPEQLYLAFSSSLPYSLKHHDTYRSRDADVSRRGKTGLTCRAVVITVLGGFLLLFGLTSFLVRGKLFLSTAVIAIVFGGFRVSRLLWFD